MNTGLNDLKGKTMIRTLSTKTRPLAAFVALGWTALAFGAALNPAPAHAAPGAFYRAELVSPTTQTRAISSDVVWSCADTACGAARATSRPAIVCARLAKEVGPLATFIADGKPLEAEALARCNGK
jgi:hypothetical protein